jgi:hypothetical protein
MTGIAAKRLSLAKAAGITPKSVPPPRRPAAPGGSSTKSDRPRPIAKPVVAAPAPHVNLTPKKTTQAGLNKAAKARPKG